VRIPFLAKARVHHRCPAQTPHLDPRPCLCVLTVGPLPDDRTRRISHTRTVQIFPSYKKEGLQPSFSSRWEPMRNHSHGNIKKGLIVLS
jgi:hypothetical protein